MIQEANCFQIRDSKMLKVLLIGFLCNVLTYSNVDAESMIKIQFCSNIVEKAISDSLKEIEQPVLRNDIGDIMIPSKSFFGNGRGIQRQVFPLRAMKFDNVRSRNIPNNGIAARFDTWMYYGDKSNKWNKLFHKNNKNVNLRLEISVTFLFKATNDKLSYDVQKCEVYLWQADKDKSVKEEGPLKTGLCRVVDRLTKMLNIKLKDSLIIDPSGNEKLIVKSISQSLPDCMEVDLNLVIKNVEMTSEQKHGYLPGNGVSVLQDYFNKMLSQEDHLSQFNAELEAKNFQITPEQLRSLIPDVSETESIKLKMVVKESPQLILNTKETIVTVYTELEAYSSKSEKSIFTVAFTTHLNADLEIQKNRIEVHTREIRDQEIHSSNTSLGKSGSLDDENLRIMLKDLSNKSLATKHISLSVRIPMLIPGSRVEIKKECAKLLP